MNNRQELRDLKFSSLLVFLGTRQRGNRHAWFSNSFWLYAGFWMKTYHYDQHDVAWRRWRLRRYPFPSSWTCPAGAWRFSASLRNRSQDHWTLQRQICPPTRSLRPCDPRYEDPKRRQVNTFSNVKMINAALTMLISFLVSKTYFMTFLSLPRRSATATINIGMKPSGKNSGPRFVSTLTVGIFYLEDLK